jgi:hypothetical protein
MNTGLKENITQLVRFYNDSLLGMKSAIKSLESSILDVNLNLTFVFEDSHQCP